MPSMLSSLTLSRKQLESCGRGVAALNSVGEACVKRRCDMRSYDSIVLSMSAWEHETKSGKESETVPSMQDDIEQNY